MPEPRSDAWQPPQRLDYNPFSQLIGDEQKKFEQEPLMLNEHEDPMKHLIGETLPAPSEADVSISGLIQSAYAGVSATAARADHSHSTDLPYAVYTSDVGIGGKTCAPGLTFLNNLTLVQANAGYGLAGNQIVVMPSRGLYLIALTLLITRDPFGLVNNQHYTELYYNNGAGSRIMYAMQLVVPGGSNLFMHYSWVDLAYLAEPVLTDNNIQLAWGQNDTANHIVNVKSLAVVRLAGAS